MSETVLIVDDEESVRRTFQEWLASSGLGVAVFAAADAESALRIVNEHPIDLAILDWNLGSAATACGFSKISLSSSPMSSPFSSRVRGHRHAAASSANGSPRLPRQERRPEPRDVPESRAAPTRPHPPRTPRPGTEPRGNRVPFCRRERTAACSHGRCVQRSRTTARSRFSVAAVPHPRHRSDRWSRS
ncbi:MAG: response regulator [Gemmataceae bacterium]